MRLTGVRAWANPFIIILMLTAAPARLPIDEPFSMMKGNAYYIEERFIGLKKSLWSLTYRRSTDSAGFNYYEKAWSRTWLSSSSSQAHLWDYATPTTRYVATASSHSKIEETHCVRLSWSVAFLCARPIDRCVILQVRSSITSAAPKIQSLAHFAICLALDDTRLPASYRPASP